MSDINRRRAILEEFGTQYTTHGLPGVTHMIAGHNGHAMTDEIIRLRDENAALKAAVERVRALHVRVQGKYFPAFCEHCDNMSYPCDTIAALEETP